MAKSDSIQQNKIYKTRCGQFLNRSVLVGFNNMALAVYSVRAFFMLGSSTASGFIDAIESPVLIMVAKQSLIASPGRQTIQAPRGSICGESLSNR